MKLSFRDIEPFVKSPNPAARVILVYGPDDGLMRERVKTMGKTVVADLNDPFNAVTLSEDSLLDDPARLSDEANAMSMMGGGRLIRITGGGDKIAPLVKDYLAAPNDQNLVIIESGELGPRSPLRGLCEKAKNAATVPCYVENERDLSSLIRETVKHAGYVIDQDATLWLSANIVGDRARARNELQKLITYMGVPADYDGLEGAPIQQNLGKISLADVQACCGNGGDKTMDDLIYSVAGAQTDKAIRFFDSLLDEGVPEIAILRALQNHFRRLHLTKSLMQSGASADEAMKSISPPVFFKLQPAYKNQLQRWSLPKLGMVLSRLSALEAQTKQSGTPVRTLCAQAILSISR